MKTTAAILKWLTIFAGVAYLLAIAGFVFYGTEDTSFSGLVAHLGEFIRMMASADGFGPGIILGVMFIGLTPIAVLFLAYSVAKDKSNRTESNGILRNGIPEPPKK